MKITVSERHMEASDALHNYVVDKVDHLSHYFDGIISVDVVLDEEKNREICELVAHLINKKTAKATEEADDMHVAIDGAVAKLKKQLRRYKARVKEKGKEKRAREDDQPSANHGMAGREGVTRAELHLRKPMTTDEAIMQLDAYSKRSFLVFMDAERNAISIVHRLSDGRYEVLEPVI